MPKTVTRGGGDCCAEREAGATGKPADADHRDGDKESGPG
jgi:hypothetical protein